MAPRQDLERLIVTGAEEGQGSADRAMLDVEEDGAHVIVVPSVNTSHHPATAKENGKGKSNSNKDRKLGVKQGQHLSEQPQNCPHLETALFFFGVAGMIVSLVMLLIHFLRKVTPFY